jgi:hypothetical protein
VAHTPPRYRFVLGVAALATVIALQPARFQRVRTTNTYPGYGALVRGCRQIAAGGRDVAAIRAEFPVATGSPLWLCTIVGAGVIAGALEVAVIDESGAVRYEPVK